jgi:hypothetical protein
MGRDRDNSSENPQRIRADFRPKIKGGYRKRELFGSWNVADSEDFSVGDTK